MTRSHCRANDRVYDGGEYRRVRESGSIRIRVARLDHDHRLGSACKPNPSDADHAVFNTTKDELKRIYRRSHSPTHSFRLNQRQMRPVLPGAFDRCRSGGMVRASFQRRFDDARLEAAGSTCFLLPHNRREDVMSDSVYKVIELIGTSKDSWEKAAASAVNRASKTLRDLRVAEVVKLDLQLDETGAIEVYRVKLNVSFKFEGT